MHPKRPDSAKSTHTRITVDSDITSKDLNLSKFSQTYSNGVKNNNQKKNDFDKYVSEKSKDPKFNKYLNSNMPEIPQKPKQSQQISRMVSKPFERRTSKARQPKIQKKAEESMFTKKQLQAITVKKQNLKNGKSFVQRNKQKLNGLKINPNIKNEEKQQSKEQQQRPQINFTGFTLKEPGKEPKKIIDQKFQQQKKEKKAQKTTKEKQQKDQRQLQLIQLSKFIEEVENRNIDYYPRQYDDFIRKNEENESDINKIDIENYRQQPNQKDYKYLARQIYENERKLEDNQRPAQKKMSQSSLSQFSEKSSSINLDQIIDGTEQEQENNDDNTSVALSSMTASELRDRNMFLTEILKGRITQEHVNQLRQGDQTHMKLVRLQQGERKKQEQLSDEEVQITKINMSKKKTTKIIQRNKIEAGGQIFYQCDYLTPQEQQRIDELINGVQIESPFVPNQFQGLRNRRINEGIRLYQEMSQEKGQAKEDEDTINEAALPKDPILRKQAELKILKQKIASVNSRLRQVDKVVVNKSKIENIVKKFKEVTTLSKMSESLIQERSRQLDEQEKKLKEASKIIEKAQKQKQEIFETLDELCLELEKQEKEVNRLRKMDIQELRQLELKQLDKKRQRINMIEEEAKSLNQQIEDFEQIGKKIRQNLQQLDEIFNINQPTIRCENYSENETIEDLDRIISIKWENIEKTVKETGENDNFL